MYLAGPFNLANQPWIRDWFKGQEALLFGNQTEIDFTTAAETFSDIVSRVPGGKKVDCMLYFFPENNCIPPGIEKSPFPVVAVISDWNINLEAVVKIAPFFSHLILDYPGVAAFRRLGFANASYVPLFAFNPPTSPSALSEK